MLGKKSFDDEDDFRDSLADTLSDCFLMSYRNGHASSIQDVVVNEKHPTNEEGGRPDIQVYHDSEIEMEWRKLSDPFFIECKIHKKEIQKNLIQGLKYKYRKVGPSLEKYGEYHVIFAIPDYCCIEGASLTRNFRKGYINDPQLIRSLWHLGMGILTIQKSDWRGLFPSETEAMQVEFNEMEDFIIKKEE